VLKSVEASKNRPVARLFFALGIPHIGGETADLLAEHFTSIDTLAKATEEQLMEIPSIGPKIAESIVAFFRQDGNKEIIEKLRKAGVKLEEKEIKAKDLPLAGFEFVITGMLKSSTRLVAEGRIKALGGKAGSDVTRKTTYVVVGTDPGSKLARAQALGIKTLEESGFMELLKQAEGKVRG
jgi:DNA ligase (NAD+)